jgi:hypothetical protein
MRRVVASSILALTMAVGMVPTAASADWGLLRWIPLLKDFYDIADAGRQITTGDLPSVFSVSFDLQDTERRAERIFRFGVVSLDGRRCRSGFSDTHFGGLEEIVG